MPTTNHAALLRLAVQVAELREKIGGRMRELREERKRHDPKWTQEYAARLVEPLLSGTQMSRWERGENRPEDDRLERIAEIYETTVADLYAGPVADREAHKSTADVLGALDGSSPQLDRIEDMLRRLLQAAGLETDITEEAEEIALGVDAQEQPPPPETVPRKGGEAERRRATGSPNTGRYSRGR